MSGRPKNARTPAQARKIQDGLALTPGQRGRAWELDVERMLCANRRLWRFFHLPRLPTKRLNQRLPADLPDWWAVGRLGTPKEGTMLVIELKTGGGRLSAGQNDMLTCLLKIPGVQGGVYYPHERQSLLDLIGDDYA